MISEQPSPDDFAAARRLLVNKSDLRITQAMRHAEEIICSHYRGQGHHISNKSRSPNWGWNGDPVINQWVTLNDKFHIYWGFWFNTQNENGESSFFGDSYNRPFKTRDYAFIFLQPRQGWKGEPENLKFDGWHFPLKRDGDWSIIINLKEVSELYDRDKVKISSEYLQRWLNNALEESDELMRVLE